MCAIGVSEEDAGKIGHNCASAHPKPPRGAAKRCERHGSIQLCDPCDPHIDMGDLIPGGKSVDTCLGQTEDILEFPALQPLSAVRRCVSGCGGLLYISGQWHLTAPEVGGPYHRNFPLSGHSPARKQGSRQSVPLC